MTRDLLLTVCALPVLLLASNVGAQSPAGGLSGSAWRLVKFQGGDDATLAPGDPSKYTVSFQADGVAAVRFDCNRGRAPWASGAPGQLQFGSLALTQAACPPGSLHDHLVMRWSSIRSYVLRGGHLFLSLMADGGTYEFEPLPAARLTGTATYRERMALPEAAVFEAQIEDVSRADAAAEVIAQTRVPSPGKPPIAFEIRYDPSRLAPGRKYVVRARILVGERLLFTTDRAVPVTAGTPVAPLSLLLRRAGP